jgi:hypothetical protein
MPGKKKARSNAGVRFEIGREQILGRYWELASLDPEITKGSIAGQLKALDSLCEELGLITLKGESETESVRQDVYRSAWMRPTQ